MTRINTQPFLVFGGAYSNLAATQSLKIWAKQNGFTPDRVICTGDIIAYCAHPRETAELIRDWGVQCIQGNVEQSLADDLDDCGCGFEEGTLCDVLSGSWYSHAQQHVSAELRNWFAQMPKHIDFEFSGKQIKVVHGAVSDVSRFIFESTDDSVFEQEFNTVNADIIIAGHSGIPFTKQSTINASQKIWHNSGALGMPANDGTSRVWFSVMDLLGKKIRFTHHALEYDVESEQAAMRQHGLTQGYDKSLKNGLWPSMDVLPEKERSRVGKPILFDKERSL